MIDLREGDSADDTPGDLCDDDWECSGSGCMAWYWL